MDSADPACVSTCVWPDVVASPDELRHARSQTWPVEWLQGAWRWGITSARRELKRICQTSIHHHAEVATHAQVSTRNWEFPKALVWSAADVQSAVSEPNNWRPPRRDKCESPFCTVWFCVRAPRQIQSPEHRNICWEGRQMGRHGQGRVSCVDGRRVLCGAFGGRKSRPPTGLLCLLCVLRHGYPQTFHRWAFCVCLLNVVIRKRQYKVRSVGEGTRR